MQPDVVMRLLKALGLATIAAITGGVGTALAFKSVDESNLLFAIVAVPLIGVAVVLVLASIIAGGGKNAT
jgi:hypothetical protein